MKIGVINRISKIEDSFLEIANIAIDRVMTGTRYGRKLTFVILHFMILNNPHPIRFKGDEIITPIKAPVITERIKLFDDSNLLRLQILKKNTADKYGIIIIMVIKSFKYG